MIMERPTGVGKVYRGDKEIAVVRYTLEIGLAKQNDVWGQITVIDGEWDFTVGQLLTLRLKDGRWFDFAPFDPSGRQPALMYKVMPAVGGRGLFSMNKNWGGGASAPIFNH
jgi:hypothetical protein